MPGPGVVVESFLEVIYTVPSQQYKIAKNSEKTGGFAHILAYKSPKTPFFALKYITRYTHETFFEEYINIKIFCNLTLSYTPRVCTDPDHFEAFYLPLASSKKSLVFCPTVHFYVCYILKF